MMDTGRPFVILEQITLESLKSLVGIKGWRGSYEYVPIAQEIVLEMNIMSYLSVKILKYVISEKIFATVLFEVSINVLTNIINAVWKTESHL